MTIEELQEQILSLTDKNASLVNEIENLKKLDGEKTEQLKKVEQDSQKRILELQEHNQKLFLKVTHKQEEPKQKDEFTSKLLGDYAKGLDEKTLEFLKEIEKEMD